MRDNYKFPIIFLLTFWILLIVILFLHVSSKINISFFHFPQSKGGLVMVEDSYNGNTNLVALREHIYAIPHGVPFIHPKRKKLLKNDNVFTAFSHQEARRMVDAKTEQIENKLKFVRNINLFNLYKNKKNNYFIVLAINENSGMPNSFKNFKPYTEYFVGKSYELATKKIKEIIN